VVGPALTVDVASEADRVRIALRGELEVATVEQADDALSLLEVQPSDTVVVDLSGVTFIDSTGLRFLLLTDRRARKDGWRLALIPAAPGVQRVFKLTRLEDRLPFLER
jgi:anti-sigma B factor antagonist